MAVEAAVNEAQSPDVPSPLSNATESVEGSLDSTQHVKDYQQPDQKVAALLPPPPKTDKPRPHVCKSCGRAFARLEHLKRHERSHTKEKPFECPECTRCFARRDLLLRHQQKLHFAPGTTRPKTARRESVSGASTTSNRVRKSSVVNSATGGSAVGFGGHRPRANTLGHLDLSSLGLLGRANVAGVNDQQNHRQHQHRMSVSGIPGTGSIDYSGMANVPVQHGSTHHLPKIDTSMMGRDVEAALHTAPPFIGTGTCNMDHLFPAPGSGNTINPAQLHFGATAASPVPPFVGSIQPDVLQSVDSIAPDDDFSWMRNWTLAQMQLLGGGSNDFAVDEPSPSGMGSDHNVMLQPIDGSIDPSAMDVNVGWMSDNADLQQLISTASFQLDALNQGLPSLEQQGLTLSPQVIQDSPASDEFFSQPFAQHQSPNCVPTNIHMTATSVSNFGSDSPSMASSMTGSARQSSVTSVSTSSITDATRQALLISLSQPSVFGHNHRKYSQPSISSPLSPGGVTRTGSVLPSTSDLQRYVNAYIQYFHPHLPFLHIPTLSFDSAEYVSNLRTAGMQPSFGQAGIIGGGGCLILAMAAIGALYEYDHAASKELFDSAKRMIQLYLEERRKADMSAAVNGSYNTTNNTPLWLVQAMLLNVIYGHNCGDKQSADIASTHCAALVSLARAADLAQPVASCEDPHGTALNDDASSSSTDPSQHGSHPAGHLAWLKWKDGEEGKRTLFAVFILSSLLVTAYNHAPAIMNSEILLDLPCDEELWAAESASDWMARGGSQAAEQTALPFAQALSKLLTANQRTPSGLSSSNWAQQQPYGRALDTRPSTFGCLILINALHNFIWETRSRHHSRQWTAKETESMFSHIEPALNAWQAAWRANERHHIQRPNPYGLGPLSADSIPLLDLAFVRLFINLGRSKEAFWQRDFDAMANEFSQGAEVAHHAEGSPGADHGLAGDHAADTKSRQGLRRPSQVLTTGHGSKREKYLRRAAFYAADSLSVSAKFSLTHADASSHELPLQSAMCFFDCSQVLAEWASTVQERVGRYLGVLGREDIDFAQVPAIMLLEAEDIDLLTKLDNICQMMEEKLVRQCNTFSTDFASLDPNVGPQQLDRIPGLREVGFGAKILKSTALMLEKAAVWPVTQVMASALEVHAAHMNQRAEASLTAFS